MERYADHLADHHVLRWHFYNFDGEMSTAGALLPGALSSAGGKQVILYGGEGHEMIDGAGGQPPNVYTFDIASLTWHKNSTTCITPDGSPGVRSLHIATVSPCTSFCLKQCSRLGSNHGPRLERATT